MDAIPDKSSDLVTELEGDAAGGGAGGEPARFEHHDLAAVEPRLGEQGGGDASRFPRAGRSNEYDSRRSSERFRDSGEDRIDRKREETRHPGKYIPPPCAKHCYLRDHWP